MFLSVKELELKKLRFDVAFAPGEIDFSDSRLRQVTPLAAKGSAELLGNTLGGVAMVALLNHAPLAVELFSGSESPENFREGK